LSKGFADFSWLSVVYYVSSDKKDQSADSGLWKAGPLAYLLTFTCYGTHLPGHAKGSVHKRQNAFGTPILPPNRNRLLGNKRQLKQPPYYLGHSEQRRLVMEAIRENCRFRDWGLIAAHVRSNHLHGVVQAGVPPEEIIETWKAYASRRLNQANWDYPGRRRWTVGGSRRYLWYPWEVGAAVRYVIEEQGEPMEVYLNPDWQLIDF
jgi:REP element-mobilizing transposase RayT